MNFVPIFIAILCCGALFVYFNMRLAEIKNSVEKQNRVLTAFITNVQTDIKNGGTMLGANLMPCYGVGTGMADTSMAGTSTGMAGMAGMAGTGASGNPATSGGTAKYAAKITQRRFIASDGTRFKWTLVNDSTQDYISLTAI